MVVVGGFGWDGGFGLLGVDFHVVWMGYRNIIVFKYQLPTTQIYQKLHRIHLMHL